MYESRKIKSSALPQKERAGQVGQSPGYGTYYRESDDGRFNCKLSCTLGLWNPPWKPAERQELRNCGVNAAFGSLLECKTDFDAASVKDAFQDSMSTQMTLMKMLDALRNEVKSRIGIERAKGTCPVYGYTCRTIKKIIEA